MDQYETAKVAYRWLRRTIGAMGVALPLLLWGVNSSQVASVVPLPSISDYYHSSVQYIFVLFLSAIAVLLFAYPGYDQDDDLAGTLAGVFAAGVVLCPTRADGPVPYFAQVLSVLHFVFAACMFGTLAVFCLVLFCRTPADRKPPVPNEVADRLQSMLSRVPVPVTGNKRHRNRVYRICGGTIVVSVALIVGYKLAGHYGDWLGSARPVFILETIALVAFGIAWMVKGEALLADDSKLSS